MGLYVFAPVVYISDIFVDEIVFKSSQRAAIKKYSEMNLLKLFYNYTV